MYGWTLRGVTKVYISESAGLLGEFPEYFHQSDVSRDETACFRSCIRPSYSSTSFPAWAAIETRSKLRLVEDSEQMMTVRAIRCCIKIGEHVANDQMR